MSISTAKAEIYVDGFTGQLEGPCVDSEGNIYFCNSGDGWGKIVCITPNREQSVFAKPAGPNGCNFGPDGRLYIADPVDRAITRCEPDGRIEVVVENDEVHRLNAPNDLCFMPDGSYYFSDPATEGDTLEAILENPNGKAFYVDVSGKAHLFDENLMFSNGVAPSLEAKFLYMAESGKHRILRYELLSSGLAGECSPWIENLPGWPDGMCIDVEGNIYAAIYGAGVVMVINPDGKHIRSIEVPAEAVTNCCFGGEDHKTLYITVPGSGAVCSYNNEIPGLPLFPQSNVFQTK